MSLHPMFIKVHPHLSLMSETSLVAVQEQWNLLLPAQTLQEKRLKTWLLLQRQTEPASWLWSRIPLRWA